MVELDILCHHSLNDPKKTLRVGYTEKPDLDVGNWRWKNGKKIQERMGGEATDWEGGGEGQRGRKRSGKGEGTKQSR